MLSDFVVFVVILADVVVFVSLYWQMLWCLLCSVDRCFGVCCVLLADVVVSVVFCWQMLWCLLCSVGRCCGVDGVSVIYCYCCSYMFIQCYGGTKDINHNKAGYTINNTPYYTLNTNQLYKKCLYICFLAAMIIIRPC